MKMYEVKTLYSEKTFVGEEIQVDEKSSWVAFRTYNRKIISFNRNLIEWIEESDPESEVEL